MLSSLAARIRELRAARELSQDDVAAHVGVSHAKWSRIERTGKLSVDELVRLQELLEVETLESFFGELPSQRAARDDAVHPPPKSTG